MYTRQGVVVVIGIMGKEIVCLTSMSTCTGVRQETRTREKGGGARMASRARGGVVVTSKGGGVSPREKREEQIGQLEV